MSTQTISQKIVARAAGRDAVSVGEIVTCKVDLAMMHDSGGPRRVESKLKPLGVDMITAYSPEARGRSERAFQTHQGRLPQELAKAGITDMAAANRYLDKFYRPRFNKAFGHPAKEPGSAFVPWIGTRLDDILCEQHERTVGNDNCMQFNTRMLQIPADQHRCHYVKARVRVLRYADRSLAVFHGPRKLARYNALGKQTKLVTQKAA